MQFASPSIAPGKALSVGLFGIILVLPLLAGCVTTGGAPPPPALTSTSLAWMLLDEEALLTAADAQGKARASLIEMNDHLDPNGPPYEFFIARSTYSRPSGDMFLQQSLIKYAHDDAAASGVMMKSEGRERLDASVTIGDRSVAYHEPPSGDHPESAVLRFSVGLIGAKVHVFTAEDRSLEDALGIAERVAQKQAAKIAAALVQKPSPSPPSTIASQALPTTLSGATFVGWTPVTESEWQGVTVDFSAKRVPGFQHAAAATYLLPAREGETLSVIAIVFNSANSANAYRNTLLTTGPAAKLGKPITLPASLKTIGRALELSNSVELQMTHGNMLIDVFITSPFAQADIAAAKQDMLRYGETIAGTW